MEDFLHTETWTAGPLVRMNFQNGTALVLPSCGSRLSAYPLYRCISGSYKCFWEVLLGQKELCRRVSIVQKITTCCMFRRHNDLWNLRIHKPCCLRGCTHCRIVVCRWDWIMYHNVVVPNVVQSCSCRILLIPSCVSVKQQSAKPSLWPIFWFMIEQHSCTFCQCSYVICHHHKCLALHLSFSINLSAHVPCYPSHEDHSVVVFLSRTWIFWGFFNVLWLHSV